MKKLCCAALLALAAVVLAAGGCYMYNGWDSVDDFDVLYNANKNVACVAGWHWDGDYDNMELTVPDEFDGIKITELGGYYGRGYPCPFSVWLPADWGDWSGDNIQDDTEYETLVFSVHLGKNIEKLCYVDGKCFCGVTLENGDEYIYDALYKIAYRFTVDGENEVFYASEGKLYYRENNELVDEFFYE